MWTTHGGDRLITEHKSAESHFYSPQRLPVIVFRVCFRVKSCVRFRIMFSYVNILMTSATDVKRHRHHRWRGICSVCLSMTEQLSRSFGFFSCLLFSSCRQSGTHTHTHTHKPTCLLSASVSADRKVRETKRACHGRWDASSSYALGFPSDIWSCVLMLF